jgi:hypothetical protein
MGLRTVSAHGLTDLERGQHANDRRAGDQTDQQGGECRKHRAKGDEVEDPQCADLILKMLGEPEQHVSGLPNSGRSDD